MSHELNVNTDPAEPVESIDEVSGTAALGENVKVIASTRQAVAFGAAFGLAAGLLGWLLRRRR